jgi:hypothetical protein
MLILSQSTYLFRNAGPNELDSTLLHVTTYFFTTVLKELIFSDCYYQRLLYCYLFVSYYSKFEH